MYSNILFIFFSSFFHFVSFCLFLTFLLCALLCYLLPIRHNTTTTAMNRVLLRHRFTNISGWLRMRTWAGELLKLERGAQQQVWPLRRLCLRHHRHRRYFFTSFFATQRRPTPKPDRCVLLRHSPPYAMVTLARLFTLRSRRLHQCARWSMNWRHTCAPPSRPLNTDFSCSVDVVPVSAFPVLCGSRNNNNKQASPP